MPASALSWPKPPRRFSFTEHNHITGSGFFFARHERLTRDERCEKETRPLNANDISPSHRSRDNQTNRSQDRAGPKRQLSIGCRESVRAEADRQHLRPPLPSDG